MRLKGRLKKLEVVVAPPPATCDCPITTYYTLADGTTYPPDVPCLRGRCPADDRWREGPAPIKKIVMAVAVRPEDGPPPGYPVRVDDFRAWDPETNRPRLQVIVWRDAETGLLCYHGPPRWCEIEGIENSRLVRAAGVTETMDEIIEELRRTDETPTLAQMNVGADQGDD